MDILLRDEGGHSLLNKVYMKTSVGGEGNEVTLAFFSDPKYTEKGFASLGAVKRLLNEEFNRVFKGKGTDVEKVPEFGLGGQGETQNELYHEMVLTLLTEDVDQAKLREVLAAAQRGSGNGPSPNGWRTWTAAWRSGPGGRRSWPSR